MTDMITGKSLREPLCSLAMGTPPPESVDLDEFDARIDAKAASSATDLDEDFCGEDSFNEDEFDAEGFDEMTFDE